ncbi:MAG: lipopolysaccharide heptosyltransferase II [Ignavibacteria bacterium]|nr:lipopolysaccharide heptosyltransferase II [Ignavibacteria bacterium]
MHTTDRMPAILHTTLVLRLSSIGDVILVTPFLRALKAAFPSVSIDVAVKAQFAELLAHHPLVDRLIAVDTVAGMAGLRTLNAEFRARRYDAVFDLHNNFRSRLLRRGTGTALRVIRKRSIRRALFVRFKLRTLGGVVPVAERYIETAADFGVRPDGRGPEVFLPKGMAESVRAKLRALGWNPDAPAIAIAPGARHFTKRWPAESWAGVARAIAAQTDAQVLLLGGPDDGVAGDAIAAAIPGRVINACGALTLLETAAAMDCCSAVACNDSGLMHLATARGIPVVAVFGSTVKELGFFPMGEGNTVIEVAGLPCRPCSHVGRDRCPEGHFRCMRDIPSSAVEAALLEVLRKAVPR